MELGGLPWVPFAPGAFRELMYKRHVTDLEKETNHRAVFKIFNSCVFYKEGAFLRY